MGLAGLVLGYVGFTKNAVSLGQEMTVLDNLYLTLGLISMNSGAVSGPVSWELQIARFLVPASAASTALIAFIALFAQQTELVRLWLVHDHVVICGLGKKGIRLANQFLAEGYRVVAIESDDRNPWSESARTSGAILVKGDATDPAILQKGRTQNAKYIFSVLGEDGKNAQVAVMAKAIACKRRDGILTCIIHLVDAELFHLLREKELAGPSNSNFRLQLFNIFEHGSRLMLEQYPPWGETVQKKNLHIMILGLGKMGESLVVEIGRRWQWMHDDQQARLSMSIIDLAAVRKTGALLHRFPHFGNFIDFHPVPIDVTNADILEAVPTLVSDLDIVYVCFDNETLCLSTGLALNQKLRHRCIPIVLRMAQVEGLSRLLQEEGGNAGAYSNLHVFHLLDQTCTIEILLKGMHEILGQDLYAAYLENFASMADERDPGATRPTWMELSETEKEKNRRQADRIPLVLGAAGYCIDSMWNWEAAGFSFKEEGNGQDEVALMAIMEHKLWCEEQILSGWRYGTEKRTDLKTHPDLLSWEELSPAEQEKNKRYIRSLPGILAKAGFKIIKVRQAN
jgi:hypothetical protein